MAEANGVGRRNKVLGIILLLVVAVLAWWLGRGGASVAVSPGAAAGTEGAAKPVPAPEAPARVELSVPASEQGARGIGARVRTEAGERDLHGRIVLFDESGAHQTRVEEGSVAAGESCDRMLARARKELPTLRFLDRTGTCSTFSSLEEPEGGGLPELVLPSRSRLTVRVTDLRQDPIEGAQLSATEALRLALPFEGRTNAHGHAELVLYAAGDTALLHVRAPGYLSRAVAIPLPTSGTQDVALARILAAGIRVDSRLADFWTVSGIQENPLQPGAFPDAVTPYGFEARAELDKIESGLELAPHEQVRWTLHGEGAAWAGEPACTFSARGADGRSWGPVQATLLHVLDPALKPVRLEVSDWPFLEAELTLELASDWPIRDADWPATVSLLAEELDRPPVPDFLMHSATRVSPGRYRLHTRAAELSLSGIRDRQILALGGAPELIRIPRLVAAAGANPPITLRIHPDSRLMRCEFRTADGAPVDLHASVSESGAGEAAPNHRGDSLVRWVRRGRTYSVRVRLHGEQGSVRLLENRAIPEPAWQSGVWRLTIPDRHPLTGAPLRSL